MTAIAPPAPAKRTGWRDRLQRWWWARLPPQPTWRLNLRNLYVLPTRPGWMLIGTLALLLIGSINFQLNLGYALTFLVAGSAAAAVWAAHANLRGLTLALHGQPELWAGQPAALTLSLDPAARDRLALELRVAGAGADAATLLDVPARQPALATVTWTPPRRGRLPAPLLAVGTRYPLGVCRVWSVWRPQAQLLVYPAPEPDAPPPPARRRDDAAPDGGHAPAPESGVPDDVRPWRAGDAPRRVLWKKAARLPQDDPAQWWVRSAAAQAAQPDLWLDERDSGLTDPEAVRARLCAWVLAADARGLRYGLRVGGVEIAPDHGPAQRRRCLEALACH
ncbi:hypothetical protein Talka_00765 [Tepidimonas alkaliphilus]|uniref:DUF58 domain-containing protein n=1 Tax=Tepidimonas alkaliphilus TaxID=2588942 RepID=A0A554WA07_9BURK|nr:DUF58 domain-containing protein [Tepidimonas alkaliphilus]TSE20419.1 hypothetical protein Talka_00765 [Tepidimonas alkaliphilus]